MSQTVVPPKVNSSSVSMVCSPPPLRETGAESWKLIRLPVICTSSEVLKYRLSHQPAPQTIELFEGSKLSAPEAVK